jgi:ribonuclease HI
MIFAREQEKKTVDIYVDGSFRDKDLTSSWAFCAIRDEKVIFEAAGRIYDKERNKSRQVAGECEAVIQALNYLARFNMKGIFYFDLINLKTWIADLFGEKPWKTNITLSRHYREYCLIHRDYISEFVKVKSHTGNKWNDYVDSLAENC